MAEYDLILRGGEVATSSGVQFVDLAIKDGKIAELAAGLGPCENEIDASGKLILPGGIDAHCHVEQLSSNGLMTADDFYSATVSAAFGGTTTIIPFAAQHKGQSLRDVVDNYQACAGPKAVIDYAYHLILSDPTDHVLGQELPAMIAEGITSFKIYMTYDSLKLDDYEILNVLATARREQALVMVHAENNDVIRWLSERLLNGGYTQPKYHAISHARIAESEATHRAIALAELLDTPLLIVHVSSAEAAHEIRTAQARGLKIYGETCPQYLFLTAEDLDRDGMEGAKFCCSPPPRDKKSQEAIWAGLNDGTFRVFSSDHAPYRADKTGKFSAGPNPTFKKIANGVPGIELRMPLLFSEGVGKGRMTLEKFIEVTATNAAKTYGIYPQKGEISVGADADVVVWDRDKQVTVHIDMLHDNMDYTPYEGMELTGWPETVISRGRIAVQNGKLKVERGSGAYLSRARSADAEPSGNLPPELDTERNFGATIL